MGLLPFFLNKQEESKESVLLYFHALFLWPSVYDNV